MGRFHLALLPIMLGIAATQTSCGTQQHPPAAPTLVAALPLTGDLSFLGAPGRTALTMAQSDAAGQHMAFNVKLEDTKADPAETATVLRRDLDVAGNQFFLVTLTAPSLTAKETLKSPQGMAFSIAIHPDIPAANRPIVRFCLSAAQEGRMLVERLARSSGPVGLVVSRDAATTFEVERIVLPGLRAAGKPPAWIEWFDVGQKDMRSLSARARSTPVRQILLLGYGSDFTNVLGAIASAGGQRDLQVTGGIGFVELNKVPDGYAASQFSFLAPAFSLGQGGAAAQAFRTRYRKLTGQEAPYDAAYTYDAAMTFARLYHEGRTSPNAMLAGLRGAKINGITGTIAIDKTGEALTDLRWGSFSPDGKMIANGAGY